MAEYDLGTARGRIELDASGVMSGAVQANRAMDSVEDRAAKANAGTGVLAAGMIGLGVAAAGAFGLAIKSSADFEKSISGFKAVSGATADQLDQVRAKALQLGADTSFSALEAADAMQELGKQGLSVEDILNGAADATVNLAAAGEISLTDAATIAANALNIFKLSAEDLPKVADTLAGAANASATGVKEIGDALAYVGPVAQSVGLNLNDTSAAIALLANNGIDASQAGTSLRSMLVGLQPSSKPARDAMEKLGLITKDGSNQFFDAQGKIKSFDKILNIMNTTFGKLTPEQRNFYLEQIFGREALAGVSAIAGTTTDQFAALQNQMSSTTAEQVAKDRLDNLSGSIEQLKGSVETWLIKAGAPMQEGLRKIVDAATGVVNWLGNLSEETQKWIGYVVAITAVVSLFVGGLLLAEKALTTVKIAVMALNSSLLTNPIFLVIAALVALGALLYKLYQDNQTFRDFIDTMWDKFQAGLEVLVAWVQTNLIPIWDRLREAFMTAWNAVWNFMETVVLPGFQRVWASIQEQGQRLADWIDTTAAPKLQELWTKAQPYVEKFLSFIENTLIPGFQKALEILGPIFTQVFGVLADTIIPGLVTGFQGFFNIITTIADFILTNLEPAINTIVGGLQTAWEWLLPKMQEAFGWWQTNIMPIIQSLIDLVLAWKDKIVETWDKIYAAAEFVWPAISAIIKAVLTPLAITIGLFVKAVQFIWENFGDTILNAVRIAWDQIKGMIEGVLTVIRGVIDVITGLISGDWSKVWEGIKTIVEGAWKWITSVVGGLASQFGNIIGGIWDFIKEKAGEAWDKVVEFVKIKMQEAYQFVVDKWTDIQNWFGGIPQRILDALGSLKDTLLNAGKDLINGFLDGIKAIWDNVTGWIKGAAEKLPDFIKGPLGISSPSKVMFEYGVDTMKGYALGLRSVLGTVQGTFGDLASAGTYSMDAGMGSPSNRSYYESSVQVNLNLPAGVNWTDQRAVSQAFDSAGVLGQIKQAAKAGVGQRRGGWSQ